MKLISFTTLIHGRLQDIKFYQFNNQVTRDHYIQTIRRLNRGKTQLLNYITEYRKDFVERNISPYDDNFTFIYDEYFIEGTIYNNDFFLMEFFYNNDINLTLPYPKDDYSSRKDFISEVQYYLNSCGYIEMWNQMYYKSKSFLYGDDNKYLNCSSVHFAMKDEFGLNKWELT